MVHHLFKEVCSVRSSCILACSWGLLKCEVEDPGGLLQVVITCKDLGTDRETYTHAYPHTPYQQKQC